MTTPPRSPRERIEHAVVRAAGALPPGLQRALAGGRSLRVDELTLDPGVRLVLALVALTGRRTFETLPPPAARAEIEHLSRVARGEPLALARVETLTAPGPAGALAARLYVPRGAPEPSPLALYFHGGGWVVGSLETHDEPCRFLAARAGVRVLAVDQRLAPEHRFPAAVDDCLAALRFATREAKALGADPGRIAVAGDSAGGNLAAVVSALAVPAGEARPAFQLLFYPVTDLSRKHDSYRLFREGFFLTEAQMDWYRGHYLPDERAALDPRASPLLAEDLAGLPPAYVATAGFDPLRDEGEAYARRLAAAGVPVELRRHEGLVHGFCNTTALHPPCCAAMEQAARALAAALHG